MLLILFGAFVGNLNKVVDYWFNSEDRDKMLIQKVDEEDGSSLSSVVEFPMAQKKTETEPIIIYKEKPVVEETPIETPMETPIVEETYIEPEPPIDGEESNGDQEEYK